jgi:hypothetical protein
MQFPTVTKTIQKQILTCFCSQNIDIDVLGWLVLDEFMYGIPKMRGTINFQFAPQRK